MMAFITNRLTRHVLEELGVEEDTAKWLGLAAGAVVGLATLDVTAIDITVFTGS
jgi:hypothetical protein